MSDPLEFQEDGLVFPYIVLLQMSGHDSAFHSEVIFLSIANCAMALIIKNFY